MMFQDLLKKTMEVNIDDILVKSLCAEDHIDHLKQSFEVLRKYNMKLNPMKCVFGIASGNLSDMLSQNEALRQISNILNQPSTSPHQSAKKTYRN